MASVESNDLSLTPDTGPEESAPAEWRELDDTGIEQPVASVSRRAPRRNLVKLGRFVVPAGGVAWALSILFHGALAAAACLLVRHYGIAIGGQSDGDSSGASGVSLVSGQSPGPILQSGLPVNAVAPDDAHPQLHRIESEESSTDPSFEDHATRSALSDLNPAPDQQDYLVIGATGATMGPPPAFHHPGVAHATASVAAGGGGGAAPDAQGPGRLTYPGMPGELAGKGFPKPLYPPEASRRGESGTVVIELEIRADGSVGRIRVVEDPGYPLLREAALGAAEKLRSYRFTPGKRDGRPITWLAIIRYPFVLQ